MEPFRAFESPDAPEYVGDADPAEVNEPFHFSPPPMIIAGIAPEWNERYRKHESKDDPEPEEE